MVIAQPHLIAPPKAPPTPPAADADAAQRTELILRRVDTLPTLPPVALRLLALTSDDDASAADVVRLVESDPALTATVLRLCRAADRAGSRRDPIPTVARAIALLGFNTLRHAVLTIGVLQVMPPPHTAVPGALNHPDDSKGLDRPGFWRHSLAVAIVAERRARLAPRLRIDPEVAFVAGLLHDLGKLALDHILPQAYAQVIALARTHRGDLAAWETRVLGVDHHRAGQRLAQHWGLPAVLAQAMARHGNPAASQEGHGGDDRPALGAVGDLSQLIGVADALVRERHVGYSGNHTTPHAAARAAAMGFDPQAVEDTAAALFPALAKRAEALGLDDTPSDTLVQQSLDGARDAIGHAHAALDDRTRRVAGQNRVLQALAAFTQNAQPAGGVDAALASLVASAGGFLAPGVRAVLYAPADPSPATPWTLHRFDSGRPPTDDVLLAPAGARAALATAPTGSAETSDADLLSVPWLAQRFERPDGLRVRPLGPVAAAWLIHPRETDALGHAAASPDALDALAGVWGHALAAAQAHESAGRLSDDLARTGAALARVRSDAAERESLARLGEMAAGAAHEMNNPLAVIRGRSQLLGSQLPPDDECQRAAVHIERAAVQLTDLITALRTFAQPPVPRRTPIDIATLAGEAVAAASAAAPRRGGRPPVPINLQVGPGVGRAALDPELIGQALSELLTNALESGPRSGIVIKLQIQRAGPENPLAGPRLQIHVRDDGAGMDAYTLAHAADPFFSARPAGRGVGMGLARVRQWAQAHGGALRIESDPDRGTTATLDVPVDSPPA